MAKNTVAIQKPNGEINVHVQNEDGSLGEQLNPPDIDKFNMPVPDYGKSVGPGYYSTGTKLGPLSPLPSDVNISNTGLTDEKTNKMALELARDKQKIMGNESYDKDMGNLAVADTAGLAGGAVAGGLAGSEGAGTALGAGTSQLAGNLGMAGMGTVAPLATAATPLYGVGKTVYDYMNDKNLSDNLKNLFAKDQANAQGQMIPQLSAPLASKDVGEKVATNTFQNGPIGSVAAVGGDLLSALQGALSKTGQFVGNQVIKPVMNTVDTGVGAVQAITEPIVDSALGKLARQALSMTAYGPAADFAANALGAGNNQAGGTGDGTSGGAEGEKGPKVYSDTLEASSQHDFIPHKAASKLSLLGNTEDIQKEINYYMNQAKVYGASAMYNPLAKQKYDFANAQIKTLTDQLGSQLKANVETAKASTRFGNYESDSDTAKQADALGESVGAIVSFVYKAKKAAKEGDIQAAESISNLIPAQLKKVTGVRASSQENSSFSAAYDNAQQAFNLPMFSVNSQGMKVFIPANMEAQVKAALALRDEIDKEFNRQADKAGATKDQRGFYRNSGTQIDDALPVVANADGSPAVNENTKKFVEPIIVGFDKDDGKPIYGDPRNGQPTKVTTISIEYDPDKFITDLRKQSAKGAVFSTHELSQLAQNVQNQNSLRAYYGGKGTAENLAKTGEGAVNAALKVGKDWYNQATGAPKPEGMTNPNNPVDINAPVVSAPAAKPTGQNPPPAKMLWSPQDEIRLNNFRKMGNSAKVSEYETKKAKAGK